MVRRDRRGVRGEILEDVSVREEKIEGEREKRDRKLGKS